MSYQHDHYPPPPGYPPPQPPHHGYPPPPPPGHGDSYQGYFGPPPPQIQPHYDYDHHHHHHHDHSGCSSFLRGWYVQFSHNCCNFFSDLMIRIIIISAILQLVRIHQASLLLCMCEFDELRAKRIV